LAHNALYDLGGEGAPEFNMAVNKFTDMTEEEFLSKYTGAIVPPERSAKMKDFKFPEPKRRLGSARSISLEEYDREMMEEFPDKYQAAPHPNSTNQPVKEGEIPTYKNWFEEGKVTKPLDQGGCGGCWAFSAAAACESLAVISGHSKQLEEYSVQQLLECDKSNYACAGGWMYEGFQYISENGILRRHAYKDFDRSNVQNCQMSNS
jgi:C1A family cysteine protease